MTELTTESVITGWIAALWSGEYDKISGALRYDGYRKGMSNHMCAQGVLLDQLRRSGVGKWSGAEYSYGRESTSASVPNSIAEEYLPLAKGSVLNEHVPALRPFGNMSKIRLGIAAETLNDCTELSFEEIGEFLYEVCTEELDINLPSAEEIRELTRAESCAGRPEDPEEKLSEEKLADPDRENGPFIISAFNE